MKYKRIKLKKYISISICLILFFVNIFLYMYTNKINNNLKKYVNNYFNLRLTKIINNSLKQINDTSKEYNFTKIYRNKEGEILYIDYNTKDTYDFINEILTDLNLKLNKEKIVIKVPYNLKQNALIYDIYPKIYINVTSFDEVSANISNNIKDYGINNALYETYINIKVKYTISSSLNNKNKIFEYKYIIDSKLINGKIPSIIYGNNLEEKS